LIRASIAAAGAGEAEARGAKASVNSINPTHLAWIGGPVKKMMITALAASLLTVTGMAQAQDGAALAKDAGCLKCHAVEKKKKGPAFKASAAEYKKSGLSGDKAVAKIKEAHEADDLKNVKSDADLKAIVAWVLAQ
jgi:cytochrome c